jgi:hypothetical protein
MNSGAEDPQIGNDAQAVLDAYAKGGTSHAADVASTIEHPALSLVMMCAFADDLMKRLQECEERG